MLTDVIVAKEVNRPEHEETTKQSPSKLELDVRATWRMRWYKTAKFRARKRLYIF